MRNVVRIVAALALAAVLAGCFPQGRHPYTVSGPQDEASQAFWTDFSAAREQKRVWNEEVRRNSSNRLHQYFN